MPKWSPPFTVSGENTSYVTHPFHVCYTPSSSQPPRFQHFNNILYGIKNYEPPQQVRETTSNKICATFILSVYNSCANVMLTVQKSCANFILPVQNYMLTSHYQYNVLTSYYQYKIIC